MYRHKPTRRERPLTQAPVPDWSRLSRNDHVEIRSHGTVIAGTIDMIAANRSVFWLIRSDGAGRTMVCFGDDVSVTKVAQHRQFAAA
ncbi:hypothetical protein [Arthrobacter sp. Z4-13]|jgi:hypothetical protein